jgi:hypothetical protein
MLNDNGQPETVLSRITEQFTVPVTLQACVQLVKKLKQIPMIYFKVIFQDSGKKKILIRLAESLSTCEQQVWRAAITGTCTITQLSERNSLLLIFSKSGLYNTQNRIKQAPCFGSLNHRQENENTTGCVVSKNR